MIGKQPKAEMLWQKVLSHRLRGFVKHEHTELGLIMACNGGVPYLEIDTRASVDGSLFAYHNPATGSEMSETVRIADTTSDQLSKLSYDTGESLLKVDRALSTFKAFRSKTQILCLDIKDYGFEREHLDLVRSYDLEMSVIFISWIPDTLCRLSELGCRSPLVLSHVNLLRFGVLGEWFAHIIRNTRLRIGLFVILGSHRSLGKLEGTEQGYQHGMICADLPDILIDRLAESRGGIAVQRRLVGPRLTHYCSDNNLKLFVFTVRDIQHYLRFARNPKVDVIFCDDATLIKAGLHEAQNGRCVSLP